MRFALVIWLLFALPAFAQHQHHGMSMHTAADAKLDVRNDAAARQLVVRVGPLHLPAHSDHLQVAQAPSMILDVPFDGWITGYHPRLIAASGSPAPGRLLHHVAFYNVGRADFLCPNKLEHIFGAGGEMNDWPPVPGYGYRVHGGDHIRVNTMFHNPTVTDYPQAWLEVRVDYVLSADTSAHAMKSVYPAWFDVQECGDSGYDLSAGSTQKAGAMKLAYSGVLLGLGGHMHDYGQALEFVNVTRKQDIVKLNARLDSSGKILSMPVVYFTDQGGYKLEKDDVLKVIATYDNPTGKAIPDGAMGIVVGYFVPLDDSGMAALKK